MRLSIRPGVTPKVYLHYLCNHRKTNVQCYICHINLFCAAVFYFTITPLTLGLAFSDLGILWTLTCPLLCSFCHICTGLVWELRFTLGTHVAPGFESNEADSHPLCHRLTGRIWSDQWCVVRRGCPTLVLMSISCLFTGMRSSCQVLIFINLKKALEGVMCRSTKCVCSSYCYAKSATATDKGGPFLYLKVLWIEGGARACMCACDRVGLNTE